MSESGRVERREVHYEGRVQGVGFRYSTLDIARRHAVSGYVMNLDDGRVRLVVEGDPHELDQFLANVAEKMRDQIRNCTLNTQPATGEFAEFRIEH